MRAVVTGGAGFIGSHLADALLARGDEVVVVDSLLTGRVENVPVGARFVEGDIRDPHVLDSACAGADVVFHQAALGSVPRSVDDPRATHDINVTGTLEVLLAAVRAGATRLVFASSSSVYGGATEGAVSEDAPLRPKSPYAASKVAGEAYVRAFDAMGAVETVILRYFNVYGPRQDPEGPYAAVVPRFVQATLDGLRPVVFGDGSQTRDFTYVEDVVAFNVLAARSTARDVVGETFNAGAGRRTSVVELLDAVQDACGRHTEPVFEPARSGDVLHSLADISKARAIGYEPKTALSAGIERTVADQASSG